MKIRVYDTKALFQEFQGILAKIRSAGSIVQNDMLLESRDKAYEYLDDVDKEIEKLKAWRQKVLTYMWENEVTDEEAEEFQRQLDQQNRF